MDRRPQRPTPALDFATILIAALEERGAHYTIEAIAEEVDGEVPTPARDIRFTDRDVVLARSDDAARLTVTDSSTGRFTTNFTTDSPLGEITVDRGWAAVEISLEGRKARFVTTHLEVAPFEGIQLPQAEQLAAEAMAADVPTIWLAISTRPPTAPGRRPTSICSTPGSKTHGRPRGARRPAIRAVTGATSRLTIVCRTPESTWRSCVATSTWSTLRSSACGLRSEARRGRWPSDHAGVVVTLRLPLARPAAGLAAMDLD